MSGPTRWIGAAVAVVAVVLAIVIPGAVEASRQDEAKAQAPRASIPGEGTERRLEEVERKLERLLEGNISQGRDDQAARRIEAKAIGERDRIIERRLTKLEDRLSDIERKLGRLLREFERTKRR